MSNALRLCLTLALTLSPAALAYTRSIPVEYDEYEGLYDTGDIVETTLDTGGSTDTAGDTAEDPAEDTDPSECPADCRDLYSECQSPVPQTYQECRAAAYEHVNWLIRYAQVIDITLLEEMLYACEQQAALTAEVCTTEYDICLTGC